MIIHQLEIMYGVIRTCIFTSAIALVCRGQLLDSYFPNLAKVTRGIIDELATNPFVQKTSKVSGDLIAGSFSALTNIPLALARAFGNGQDIPTEFKSNSNIVDFGYVIDFKAGLANEDANLPIEKLLKKYGYVSEKHKVTTDDGYVLTLFRIPSNGSAVFLMHGIVGSADDFVMAGPRSGLAYLLASEGFDVWMGNARGNKFCRQHIKLQPSNADFWDFSWHEIGYYDLPAMIDYVLNVTERETVKYVGHSQGTTTFFVMASERPEYNDKIELMIALSPVAFMSHTKSPIVRLLAAGTGPLHAMAKTAGIYEFFGDTRLTRLLKRYMCGYGPISELLCSNPILLFVGFSFVHLNMTNLPVVYGHIPSGASAKQFAHFGQGVLSGEFRQFDYGCKYNVKIYGSEKPPTYKLENVRAPVALLYSDADWLAQPEDVNELASKLGNVIDKYEIPFELFNHMDFLIAKDFKAVVYRKIRKLLGDV